MFTTKLFTGKFKELLQLDPYFLDQFFINLSDSIGGITHARHFFSVQ